MNLRITIIIFSLFLAIVAESKTSISRVFLKMINGVKGEREIASSVLIEKGRNTGFYAATKAFDNNIKTAWVPKKKGGIGEFLFFQIEVGLINNEFPKEIDMYVVNGLAANDRLFKYNNRIKKANLEIYECEVNIGQYKDTLRQEPVLNSIVEINLDDTIKPQVIKLIINNKQRATHKYTGFMYIGKLIIKDIYKGSKYDDTCISEIYFKTKLPFKIKKK